MLIRPAVTARLNTGDGALFSCLPDRETQSVPIAGARVSDLFEVRFFMQASLIFQFLDGYYFSSFVNLNLFDKCMAVNR
jgi:hypothetical protein